MKTIFVTGADGFLGKHVCSQLIKGGYSIRGGVRTLAVAERLQGRALHLNSLVELGDIGSSTIPLSGLRGCDAVVHLAARVHVMHETAHNPLAQFRSVNVEGTRHVAEAALAAGVRRFVFVSSIKVNGEFTHENAFSETSIPQPRDPYAVSKREAEELLLNIASSSGLEVAIVRPPLIYGPGVRGNLYRLMRHLYRGLPLVLPPGENTRSLVGIENIASLLSECAINPRARNQIFLASDGRDLSTRELIGILSSALKCKPRIVAMPKPVVALARTLPALRKRLDRLGDSLRIDSSKARSLLGWTPQVCPEAGLTSTAEWFFAAEKN